MADHFVSLTRGEQGFRSVEFTTGTSSAAADAIELRVLDGANMTKQDVITALNAFERFFRDSKLVAGAGFDVKG